MKSKTILLFIIILFVTGIIEQSTAQNEQPYIYKHSKNTSQFNSNIVSKEFEKYDVNKYRLNLAIDPDLRYINSDVKIVFTASENNLSDILLNFKGMQIDSILYMNTKLNFNRQQNELSIALNNPLQFGEKDSIAIFYQGIPLKGMYFRNSKYNRRVAYTHNEPFDAQYWFPCKDDPSDKALLDVFVTVPNNLTVVSNGSLMETNIIGQGHLQYFWKELYPISTYLISIIAAELNIISNSFSWNALQMPVEYYIYPEDQSRGESAIAVTIEMLDFFSNLIGEYPFFQEKYGMVEVPFSEAAAMENQTITTMDEPIIDNESVIAHELAHQWWGDAVTPTTFSDIWLNEGFATFFDALFVEYKFGDQEFQNRMISSKSQTSNDGSVDYAIYNPPMQYLFGSAVYHKGAWVLYMLRNKVGKSNFERIIRNYFNMYIYKNVTTSDFIDICENVSGHSLYKFFDQWVFTSGIPNLFASWTQQSGIVDIQFQQLQNETVYEFDIDLRLISADKDTTFTVSISDKYTDLVIPYSVPISQLIIDPDNKILNVNNGPVYIIPDKTELIQLYPNPFNNKLNIFYRVNKYQNIKIEIWNILGKKIITLFDQKKKIGTHQFTWRPNNLATGTYICILKSESTIDVKKVLLIK